MVRRKNVVKGKSVHLSAQLPAELIRDIDALAEKMASELRVSISRSDMVRKLLEEGVHRAKESKR